MDQPSASEGKVPLMPRAVKHSRTMFRPKDTILDESSPTQGYRAFSFIFVFPLPSKTTEEDEERFRKRFLHNGKTHRSIMDSLIIHHVARADKRFSIECGDSLRSMRNATIEIFQSFFETIFGDDGDCGLVMFSAVDNDELFMCIRLSDHLIEQFADMADYPLQLDISALEKLDIQISDQSGVVPAFVKFDAYQKEHGLLRTFPKPEAPDQRTLLRRVDHIRLIYDKLTDYMDLPEMEEMGLVSHLPCHNPATVMKLRREWGTLSKIEVIFSLTQPIEDIRNYLGEGVAFYFLFVQELAKGLLLLMPMAALCEVGVRMYTQHTDKYDLAVMLYSFVLMAWFSFFNKWWRRTEAYYMNAWGMDRRPSHSEIHEPMNPTFQGELRPWPIDESVEVEEPIQSKLIMGWTLSVLGQLLFTGLIVVCVSYTQYVASVQDAKGHKSAHKWAALAVSVQIQVFSYLWGMATNLLTDEEQHVTMRAWHESKARKTFAVGFFNTFFSFFYVGFVQQLVDPAAVSGNALLQTNMLIVYGTYVAFAILDIVKPYLEYEYTNWREGHQEEVNYLENQSRLSKYSGESLAADYMQVCFSLCFVVLFSTVMPLLTVFLAFLTMVVQLRADAWKLMNTYRRTFPDMVDGIGIWRETLSVLELVMICVNLLLLITHFDAARFISLVPGVRDDLLARPVVTKLLIYSVTLNLVLGIRALFCYAVPDEPERVSLEKKRQDLQRARLTEQEEEFREGATMWATGDAEASAFETVPPLEKGQAFFLQSA